MVKPIPARRLSKRTTMALHEVDVSSNEETTNESQSIEPPEVERTVDNGEQSSCSWEEAVDSQEAEALSHACSNGESPSGGGDYLHQRCPPAPERDTLTAIRNSLQVESHNHFASSYICPAGVSPQTAALSQDLYLRFLSEEIRIANVRRPRCLDPWQGATLDRRYCESLRSNMHVRQSLREVATVFAMSHHRELVRQKAEFVDIELLDFNSFQDLLFGLFQEGGVTSERVVVLFFFCSDLIVRTLRDQLATSVHHLIDWSQFFFAGTLSVWVEQHGGWVAVLDQSANRLYTAAKIGLMCATIVALCIYIRNNR